VNQALVVALLAGCATLFTFMGLRFLTRPDDLALARVEEHLAPRQDGGDDEEGPAGEEKKARSPSALATRLNQWIMSQDFAGEMGKALVRADVHLTVPEYAMLNVASICISFLIGTIFTRNVLIAVGLTTLGFLMPGWYLKRREAKRVRAFEDQLGDVLTLLVGSLRAGYSLLHAMDVVAKEVPPPTSDEFKRVVREVGLGLSQQEALNNLVGRVNLPDLDLVVSAINIQHEVGGNLATILDTISATIRDRMRIQGEIRVMTTQQRVTGYVLTLLPFGLGLLMYLINPKYMSRLFTPGWTLIIPFGATISVFIGFMIIRKIVAIEV
jgi:tight adherence protein B